MAKKEGNILWNWIPTIPPSSLCEWYWIVSIGGSNVPWHAIYFLQPPPRFKNISRRYHIKKISPSRHLSLTFILMPARFFQVSVSVDLESIMDINEVQLSVCVKTYLEIALYKYLSKSILDFLSQKNLQNIKNFNPFY